MYVHIVPKRGSDRFLCGCNRNAERPFISLDMYRDGGLLPAGETEWCPVCKAAADKSNLQE